MWTEIDHAAADRELQMLCDAFAAGAVNCLPSKLEHQHDECHAMPSEPQAVLAISFGGSNTKLMLASVGRQRVDVIHATTRPNPIVPTDWREFVRDVLAQSPEAMRYLQQSARAKIGVSIAVPITDGVPHHPSKMPTLQGLVSRDPQVDRGTHQFDRNLAALLTELGARRPIVAVGSDGVLAHLGAFALSGCSTSDATMLVVCGTGLACATRRQFILCGMASILPDDNPLTDHRHTEGGQYQHLIAGKGLWGMMRRSIQEMDNRPGLQAMLEQFASAADSIRVRHLAGGEWLPRVPRTHQQALVQTARQLIQRGAVALANCVLASARHAYPESTGRELTLFIEGSVAQDPLIMDIAAKRFRAALPMFPQINVHPGPRLNSPVDVTLVGAAILGRLAS